MDNRENNKAKIKPTVISRAAMAGSKNPAMQVPGGNRAERQGRSQGSDNE